ncbi:hypothetical protein N7495_003285 [Penicillium taxi]|uniref:uncharacterized protein n=1 Tax=Penicillium taxi TaxID=168475 RepID=UPI00254550E3|nr:uncharacterized protein N7495_003285 [Penicillium taxi]KAJ5902757.1 hypothetical protein N7495_003285 [Penicillium taxi]
MEALLSSPDISTFVTLADHQSRTPSSFHSGPPVLHFHSKQCKVIAIESEIAAAPALKSLRSADATNGTVDIAEDREKQIIIDGVEIWVTSDKLFLFNSEAAGVSIPYPSISLHALQRLQVPGSSTEETGVYMQIAVPTSSSEDDYEESLTITIVTPTETATEATADDLVNDSVESTIQQLFDAISACSYLHPDPVEPGDEDHDDSIFSDEPFISLNGDLPPPVSGSSGWITSENMSQFFDEHGNWIGNGEPSAFRLGPGAGSVRGRETDENGTNDEETKWQRTD